MPTPVRDTDYERADVGGKLVALLAAGFVAMVLVTLVVLRFVYPQAIGDQGGSGPRKPLAAEPRLQADDTVDLAAMRRAEELRMTRYGWVDRSAGLARIPVDEAVRLTAERGLPGWSKADR